MRLERPTSHTTNKREGKPLVAGQLALKQHRGECHGFTYKQVFSVVNTTDLQDPGWWNTWMAQHRNGGALALEDSHI